MSDTIALCTRILLTTQDPNSKELDHGGSSRAKGTRGGKQKRNITELLGCSRQGQISIYSRSRKLNPSAREAISLNPLFFHETFPEFLECRSVSTTNFNSIPLTKSIFSSPGLYIRAMVVDRKTTCFVPNLPCLWCDFAFPLARRHGEWQEVC